VAFGESGFGEKGFGESGFGESGLNQNPCGRPWWSAASSGGDSPLWQYSTSWVCFIVVQYWFITVLNDVGLV